LSVRGRNRVYKESYGTATPTKPNTNFSKNGEQRSKGWHKAHNTTNKTDGGRKYKGGPGILFPPIQAAPQNWWRIPPAKNVRENGCSTLGGKRKG